MGDFGGEVECDIFSSLYVHLVMSWIARCKFAQVEWLVRCFCVAIPASEEAILYLFTIENNHQIEKHNLLNKVKDIILVINVTKKPFQQLSTTHLQLPSQQTPPAQPYPLHPAHFHPKSPAHHPA